MTELEAANAPSSSQLRWFGLVLLIAAGVVGSVLFWRFELAWGACLVCGLAISVVIPYYLVPRLRVPIFRSWMRFVMPIGWVITHLLLGLVYFLLLTPMGAVSRLIGRDVLGRRPGKSTGSHWQAHDPGGDTDRYFRQT